MKGKGKICLIVMLMIIAGCMESRLSDVWVDETYQKGPINDVLVMAIFPSPERRKMIEDEMGKQLRSRGVNTLLSYVEFPGKQLSEDELISQTNKIGISSVLVTKFIKREYKSSGNPYDPLVSPESQPYAIIEINLYDVKTQKKIWSALSETWIIGMDSRLTSSFVSTVLKKLADDKFVR